MSEDQTAPSSTEPDGGTVAGADRSFETSTRTGVAFTGQTLTIAQLEYRLSMRSRWTVTLTALFGFLSLIVVTFGGAAPGPVRVDAVVVSLASLATYLVPLAALVYGFDTVVGAEETGWLDMVFALPVSRGRVVLGAFLGRAVSLAGATAIGFGLGGLMLFVRVDTVPWGLYANVLFGTVTLGLAFLALSVLVSTVAAEKTHALGIALLVWVWLVFGHDLAALGLVAALDLPNVVLTGLVLANPIDIFRVFVLSGIENTGSGMAAVVSETSLSKSVLIASSIAWVVLPVSVAARLIRRRSL
jgi:Cu-processing system permease protein